MPKIERVCPTCGTSNAYARTQCAKCRAPLTGAPASAQPPELFWSRKTMAHLAWRATKFMTVMGATLAWRGAQRGVEKFRATRRHNVQNETIEGDYTVPSPDASPEHLSPARVWGVWRDERADDTASADAALHWGSTSKQKTG